MSICTETCLPRKRARDEDAESELDVRPLIVQDATQPFARPRTFTPVCLLSRAQLPLASLDPAPNGTRFFSAHVPVLGSDHGQEDEGGAILVARDETDGRLYAIERVQRRTHALCRLAQSMSVADAQCMAKTLFSTRGRQAKRQAPGASARGQAWWHEVVVGMPEALQTRTDSPSLPALAMQRVMQAPQEQAGTPRTSDEDSVVPAPPLPPPETDVAPLQTPPSAQDVLQELAKHYIDALYLSRTSLAYFAKGPLSRARAALSRDQTSSLAELAGFMRESILTSAVIDKKYKDGISDVVQQLPVLDLTSAEKSKVRKTRRKWKAKRDKNGFYVNEQDALEQWWRREDENDPGQRSAEKMEIVMRRRLPKLRSRETFLQIILVLEVLALEATEGASTDGKLSTQDIRKTETQHEGSQSAVESKKAKAKKKADLASLLETLLDKLCIWHSLESQSPAKTTPPENQPASEETADELKSFCIEVIVPFYVARVPHYAAIVNKKLGGPTAPSPARRKPSAQRKVGEPAIRPPPEKKPRNPLARVSTDTLNQSHKHVPSLHRSATDSEAVPFIKRERSASLSLDTIPLANAPSGRRERPSLMQQMSFSRREIDLSAMSAANEAKMKKKADVERKLREAISTLKKPNRALAVKEMEERTDEMFVKSSNAAKKNAKRASSGAKEKSGMQTAGNATERINVTATPSHVRTIKSTPYKPSHTLWSDPTRFTESAITHISSSSTRLHSEQDLPDLPTSTPAIPQSARRPRAADIQDTPSRGFAKFMPAGLARVPGTLDSPVAARKPPAHAALVHQTPSKSASRPSESQPLVTASPNLSQIGLNRGQEAGSRHAEPQDSIYDALGWDDEEYERLA